MKGDEMLKFSRALNGELWNEWCNVELQILLPEEQKSGHIPSLTNKLKNSNHELN